MSLLKPNRPTTNKTQKEKSLESVIEIDANDPVKMKRFNVDIPEVLHRDIKVQAAREGIKLNDLAIRLFNEYLSKISK